MKAGKSNRGVVCAAAAALAALAFGGCGSGEETQAPTEQQFLRQGNAICKKWQQAREESLSKGQQEIAPPITQKKISRLLVDVLTVYEGAINELAELQPPEKDQEEVEALIASIEEGIARGKAHPPTLLTGNVPFKKSNKAAEAYGLDECTA